MPTFTKTHTYTVSWPITVDAPDEATAEKMHNAMFRMTCDDFGGVYGEFDSSEMTQEPEGANVNVDLTHAEYLEQQAQGWGDDEDENDENWDEEDEDE